MLWELCHVRNSGVKWLEITDWSVLKIPICLYWDSPKVEHLDLKHSFSTLMALRSVDCSSQNSSVRCPQILKSGVISTKLKVFAACDIVRAGLEVCGQGFKSSPKYDDSSSSSSPFLDTAEWPIVLFNAIRLHCVGFLAQKPAQVKASKFCKLSLPQNQVSGRFYLNPTTAVELIWTK